VMGTNGHWRRRAFAVALTLALAVAVSACGDSNSESGKSGSSGSGQSVNPELVKAVNAASKPPEHVFPNKPIGKPIPAGKKLVFINCGAPACTNMGASFKQAASVLGWNVNEIQAQPTPQSIQAAFSEAVRQRPDGVVSTGFSKELYRRQLDQLHEMKIPVFSGTGTDPTGPDINLEPLPPASVSKATKLLADKTIVDAGGKGEIGAVLLTGYPIVKIYTDAYLAEIKSACPKCTTKTLVVQPTSIGKDAGAKIANFLRSNPKIGHLFLSYDALGVGLKQAVTAAGAKYPKTYSWAPDQTGVKALQTGERTASIPLDYPEIGWQWADAFARLFTGGTVKPDDGFQNFVIWSKDFNNVPASAENPPAVQSYQDQFKKLWGKE
jgi:ribose transport system substrate-binding protein